MLDSNNNESAMKVLLPSVMEGIEICEESYKSLSTGWTLKLLILEVDLWEGVLCTENSLRDRQRSLG